MTLAAHDVFRPHTPRHAKTAHGTPDRRFSVGTALTAGLIAAVPAASVTGSVVLAAATATSVLIGVILAAFLISSVI